MTRYRRLFQAASILLAWCVLSTSALAAMQTTATGGAIPHGAVSGWGGGNRATISAWFFINGTPAVGATLFSGGLSLFVVTHPSDWRFSMSGGGGTPSVVSPPIREWFHFGFLYNGSGATDADRCKVYYNGLQQTPSFLNPCDASITAAASPVIFGNQGGAFMPAGSKVAYLKWWKHTMNEEQLRTEMQIGRPVMTEHLILYAPYNDGSPPSDYSGNGFPGTSGTTAAPVADGPPIPSGD